MKYFLAILLLGSFGSYSVAQQTYTLDIKSLNNEFLINKISYKKSFTTSSEREKELKNVLFFLYDNAYLAAEYVSLKKDSLNLTAYLNPGNIYKWASLEKGNVDEGLLNEINFREKIYNNKPLYFKEVKKLQERIIIYCENNGYPFASVKLDSIVIKDNLLHAKLHLEKNKLVKTDSVLIKGKAKISEKYLQNYLSIKPGDLYNESEIKRIDSKLRSVPFFRITKPTEVIFTEKTTKINLYLENKKASQADGIIGFLPDNKTGKILFTGDVKLKLQNAISKGESIELNWRRLQVNTQDLKTRLTYPFLFNTPFGIDYLFKIYKKDTTFIDVSNNIAVQYLLSGNDYFKIFLNSKTSSLLATKGLTFVTKLPPYADISSKFYGIGYRSERLDYRLNPRKGFLVDVTAGAGNKRIKKNQNLNESVYDSLKLNTNQYNTELDAEVFLPIKANSTFKIGVKAAMLYGENIFANELFRIGGFRTLRGFDEESIFASRYSIFTLEYRYILEENSYMYVFTDGAVYENKSNNTSVSDTPIGFGAGISFETKAGIFSITYALGKQFNNPILLRAGKIHFGLVNYF